MRLKHLIQAYNFNRIPVTIKQEINQEKERAGVIRFNENINAAYLLDEEEFVIALNIFCNCITKELTIDSQISNALKVVEVLQKTIELISNIPIKEANMILEKLGLFDNTFQKRKENKTFRTCLRSKSNKWIITI